MRHDVPQLFTPEFTADPYRTYAWLREHEPVKRVRLPSGMEAWLVTRYADARRALADPRLSKDPRHDYPAWRRGLVGLPGEERYDLGFHVLNADPPDHTRLRRLVNKAFTPRRVAGLAPRIQQLTDQMLDEIAPRGEADLMGALAHPLPIIVICELMGVPEAERAMFRSWVDPHAGSRGGIGRSTGKLRDYLHDLIDRKRAEPRDDLLSALVRAHDEEGSLDQVELASMAYVLIITGHETTVNLIGNGILALLTHPDQRKLLADNPGLLDGAIEEFLRYDGPVETATWRFATEDVEIAGVRIPKGDPVLVVIAAANRDPERFAEPDRLDITRTDAAHLSFGYGIHYCVGAPLARLQGRIAIETVFRRFPDLELAVPYERLRWRSGLIRRGVHRLPVRFERDRGAGQAYSVAHRRERPD
ncbi:cytochrome P450 [Carbonactinospora thermoautotrophica]|uniref:Cytochrome P450 n=1 Tax=Carbonactinospora thermoautotrophica TaxID=1469144 RepID=A0A132N4L6_9ACTN|nr:cytochrome P450 [Carbonactinospora thermoautotrophica]KWW99116.1 putative cytochrome P450 hydroxylase [Carbonactinospora thermoautotrophica]KWX05078.1 cytochrome P450 [Carbonactinospora thermoautotrophica]KWX08649.1 cytochrome P450 [Carbonactinospora thermoautotrophica]